MATYSDKTINLGERYGDTNVNVFEFGFLPLNEVFDYGGTQAFIDKNTTSDKKESVLVSFVDKNTTNYSDKTINLGERYEDTNVNVFEFGFLPLNEVFDYEGTQAFIDKNTTTITSFSDKKEGLLVSFDDKKVSFSEPILSQKREPILSQDKEHFIGFYRGFMLRPKKQSTVTNFTDKKTNESS